jgi:hypothetical protein
VVNVGDHGSSDVWDLQCQTVADGLRSSFDVVTVDDGDDHDRAAQSRCSRRRSGGGRPSEEGEFMGDLESLPTGFSPPQTACGGRAVRCLEGTVPRSPDRRDSAPTSRRSGRRRSDVASPAERDVELIRRGTGQPAHGGGDQSGSAVVCSGGSTKSAVVQA